MLWLQLYARLFFTSVSITRLCKAMKGGSVACNSPLFTGAQSLPSPVKLNEGLLNECIYLENCWKKAQMFLELNKQIP